MAMWAARIGRGEREAALYLSPVVAFFSGCTVIYSECPISNPNSISRFLKADAELGPLLGTPRQDDDDVRQAFHPRSSHPRHQLARSFGRGYPALHHRRFR